MCGQTPLGQLAYLIHYVFSVVQGSKNERYGLRPSNFRT